jgi:TolB-like protein/DNA-binding winged helix-turn-helix (wHTH) protein/Flp pilus assembly protein TadD
MIEASEITLETPFFVADWHVDPSLGRISHGQKVIKLEPKVMMVLLCLAREAGDVISREQLESTVWADRVVGYDSLATAIIKLRKAFEDDSKNPQIIETVPKRGYRLIAPVSAVNAAKNESVTKQVESTASANSEAEIESTESHILINSITERNKTVFWITTASVMFVMLIIAIVYIANGNDRIVAPANGKLSIAVLPFKNISNDPQQNYFSDGMTADLITDLSRLSALSVIARNSVFAYRDENVDVRKVGQELGAQYVIEGSVRKVGNEVRISARLIDSSNGYNLWAERFDGKLDHVFALQDEVTARIVKSLKLTLTETERTQLIHKYTNSIEAYDYFLQGWQYFWNMSRAGNKISREAYLKAIELDNTFARAYANLALTYAYEYLNGWSDDPKQSIKKANEYANKAVRLDDKLSQVYWALGVIQSYSRNYKDALETSKKALALDPNYADGYGLLATVLNYAGKPKQALEAMATAMRLNPRYPSIYRMMRGEMNFNAHYYKKAIDDFNFALDSNPEVQEARLWLAAAYVYSGNTEDAKWQVDELLGLDSKLTLASFEQVIPLNDPTQRKHLIDGLHKAGLK